MDTRDYDVERQTLKHLSFGLLLTTIVFIGLWQVLQHTVAQALSDSNPAVRGSGLASAMVFFFVGGLLIMLQTRISLSNKMEYARQGYDVRWSLRPRAWFGSHEYTVKREDDLGLFGAKGYRGFASPIIRHRDEKLQNRIKEQRKLPCEVCGRDAGQPDTRAFDRKTAYFVEHRQAFYLFGVRIPFTQEIKEVEAYCKNHKPENWDS